MDIFYNKHADIGIKIEPRFNKVHFIGIGGSSMNGIAEIVLNYGCRVSGSDRNESSSTKKLEALGAKIFYSHDEKNLPNDCDLVIYTLAIAEDNPELLKAKKLGIKTVERGKFLGYLTEQHKYSLAVSGTHGKTTTTSMIATILLSDEKDPCVHLGGYLPLIQGSVRASLSEYFVTEACEYHKNLLNLVPYAGIILNVEAEHLDFYKGGLAEIKETFSTFASKINPQGFLVLCADNENAMETRDSAACKILTYSIDPAKRDTEDYTAINIQTAANGKSEFDLCFKAHPIVHIELQVPGKHNISNAVAAAAACHTLGCRPESIQKGLALFEGANRRFECKGTVNGACIVDDYAHHPTEIKAVLDTARTITRGGGKIWSIFQPHTYSRAKIFADDFCEAFRGSYKICISDIYAAREKNPGDINSQMLADKFRAKGLDAEYMPDFTEIVSFIRRNASGGDLVITFGAGDINKVAIELAGK